MKKTFEDIFCHDFPLILAEMNNDEEVIEMVPWSEKRFKFKPFCIHARQKDGMLHYIYDTEGIDWKVEEAGKADEGEITYKLIKHYEMIKEILEEERALNKEEFAVFCNVFRQTIPWFECLYWMIEYRERNRKEMTSLLETRKKTEKLFPGCSAVIKNTLKQLYPEKGKFIDVITYKEAMTGNLPEEDVLLERLDEYAYSQKQLFKNTEEAMKHFNIAIKEEENDLTGQTAFPGKITGKVKIIKTREDMKNFEEGNILVASSTTPDFMPAIKKAGAIISEHGGAISHASITSRELKIICIVGVKGATKLLKDGDLVEVDATNRTVRKIE